MDVRDKLLTEAGLAETKVILGWLFNFRQLQIFLPKNKIIAWTANFNKLIADGTTCPKRRAGIQTYRLYRRKKDVSIC
jgi:hypothetical protein